MPLPGDLVWCLELKYSNSYSSTSQPNHAESNRMQLTDNCCSYCWILLDLVGACWILLDLVGSCWILLDLVGSCWILLDLVGSCWILLDLVDLVGACWILLHSAGSALSYRPYALDVTN